MSSSKKMFQTTKSYLNARNESGKDYKKLFDAEMKYKMAYMKYEDSKVKTIDLDNAVEACKAKIGKTQKEFDQTVRVLTKKSEEVFY